MGWHDGLLAHNISALSVHPPLVPRHPRERISGARGMGLSWIGYCGRLYLSMRSGCHSRIGPPAGSTKSNKSQLAHSVLTPPGPAVAQTYIHHHWELLPAAEWIEGRCLFRTWSQAVAGGVSNRGEVHRTLTCSRLIKRHGMRRRR